MLPVPAPARLSAINTILRRGRRSATCKVSVVDEADVEVATGAIGFAHVPRQPGAPPKIMVKPEEAPALFQGLEGLAQPLRDAAGVVTLDAAAGVVEIAVVPEVCNPAGTLQGAMVALVAEAAVEDLLGERHGGPVVVTELDIRYLQQAGAGPVRSRCRVVGEGVGAAVQVELVDTATDRITTLAYAHAQPVV
jgi:acyl-coenzyme A thioesterase PaaI-like protein